jgi:hypothetical protein
MLRGGPWLRPRWPTGIEWMGWPRCPPPFYIAEDSDFGQRESGPEKRELRASSVANGQRGRRRVLFRPYAWIRESRPWRDGPTSHWCPGEAVVGARTGPACEKWKLGRAGLEVEMGRIGERWPKSGRWAFLFPLFLFYFIFYFCFLFQFKSRFEFQISKSPNS